MKRIGIFLLFFGFFVKPIVGQPTSSDMNFTKINLSFYNCKKDTIRFLKEKTEIKSIDNNYVVGFIELENDKEIKNLNYYASISNNCYLNIGYQSFDKDTKKTLKVIVHRKRKKMIIFFKINAQSKPFIPFYIKMHIPFKKGIYVVSDPENPKLLKI